MQEVLMQCALLGMYGRISDGGRIHHSSKVWTKMLYYGFIDCFSKFLQDAMHQGLEIKSFTSKKQQ